MKCVQGSLLCYCFPSCGAFALHPRNEVQTRYIQCFVCVCVWEGVGGWRWGSDWLIGLTQRRAVGHQDVDAFWNEVPFIQQRLTPRQIEAPAVEPRRPAKRRTESVGINIATANTGVIVDSSLHAGKYDEFAGDKKQINVDDVSAD